MYNYGQCTGTVGTVPLGTENLKGFMSLVSIPEQILRATKNITIIAERISGATESVLTSIIKGRIPRAKIKLLKRDIRSQNSFYQTIDLQVY